ncbi:MAG: formyltransferase [Burkholderiales bacterium]|nr:formyltransferase [Burkholderiales bacterium]MDE2159379.1 formyltransferase [Burkholderiales bacterium]MDE2501952.1 formyltransferase [Burkholderiales bacterium]
MRAVVFAYSNVGDRCLRVLHAGGVEVALVATHRDHPGETLWFSRVADTAAELGLPTIYADDPKAPELRDAVAAAQPDLIFSFYYRSMIPAAILELAPAYNLHGSLLPRFRGRAPTNWAVLEGATETGATLHEMVAQPDAGAIVDQQAVPILPDDTGQQVFDKVCTAAEIVLWRSLPALLAGRAPRLPNDLAAGSYRGGRKPEDGRIDWSQPARRVYDLIRAVAPPYPGAFAEIGGERLVIAEARRPLPGREPATAGLAPGLHVVDGRIVAVCGDGGAIEVRRILAGSAPLAAAALAARLHPHSPVKVAP